MPDEYTTMVSALKALTQGEAPNTVTLPVAESEWDTRPDVDSYGVVNLDFEAGADRGDDVKDFEVYEGSIDLFSRTRSGSGWVELICNTLTAYCDGSWSLNSHTYERDTGYFHWEWTFELI